MIQTTHRVFDEHQARKTLRTLERSVAEFRATHRCDDDPVTKLKLTRIAVIKMQLRNKDREDI